MVEQASDDPIQALLLDDISIINVGLTRFADTLEAEGIDVLHVDWRPPAGGDGELARMLAALTAGHE